MNKLSYSFGMVIGNQLLELGAEVINVDDFSQAIKDMFTGKNPEIDPSEAQMLVSQYIQQQEHDFGF